MGYGHTITTPNRLFENESGSWLLDVNVNPTELVINGQELSTFAIVTSTSADDVSAANLIKNHVQTKYSISLPIKTSADNYVGNAIYINLGNNYYVKGVSGCPYCNNIRKRP